MSKFGNFIKGIGNSIGTSLKSVSPDAWLSSGMNVIGTLMNNATQRNQQEREMNFARESYATQRADVLADRTHEEAFNSPIQQSQRLRQAGLNPVDYMGNPVSSSTGDSGQIAQPSHADVKSPLADIGNIIGMSSQLKNDESTRNLQSAQMKDVDASANLKNAQAEEIAKKSAREEREVTLQEASLAFEKEKWSKQVEQIDKAIELQNCDIALKRQAHAHLEELNAIELKLANINLSIQSQTINDVVDSIRWKNEISYQQWRNLGRQFVMNGPKAYVAQANEFVYGQKRSALIRQISSELELNAEEAEVALYNISFEHNIATGNTNKFDKWTANTFRQFNAVTGNSGTNHSAGSMLEKAFSAFLSK